jgi:hypothetical protein
LKINRNIFSDIRFWILLYFLIRLIQITQPPLEIAHNWRQCTGLMVSRNFYEINANIIYPRVDMAGEKTGITGTEFPLFNYLIYLFAKVFGWTDWYGRFINLIVSSFGIYWFSRLVAGYFTRKHAFYASLILLNSLWFAYSRKTMPDTFSISLAMGGLLFALEYLRGGRAWNLFVFFILTLSGLLSKIPAGLVLVVLILPYLDPNIKLGRKVLVGLLFGAIMVPVSWWYFLWVPYLVKEFGFWHYYMGTGIINGAHEIMSHMDQTLEKFYFPALNYIGFGLFLIGIVMAFIRKEKRLLQVFGLCFIALIFYMLKAGFAFYHHNYYILPFVPVMALMAGYTLSQVKKPVFRNVLAFAVAVEIIINALPEFRVNSDQKYKLNLESLTATYAKPGDLIAINCGPNPQQIYLAHRKGWNLENGEQLQLNYLNEIKAKGCKVLIINKHEDLKPKELPFKKLSDDADFTVYSLF